MRMHPIWGEHILEHGQGFKMARHIARWHHENIDGTGYPDGLKGDAIPLEARIVRLCDSFDEMTHNRPYKPARAVSWALAEMERCAGTQFDPELAKLFVELLQGRPNTIEEFIAARAAGIYAHIADRGSIHAPGQCGEPSGTLLTAHWTSGLASSYARPRPTDPLLPVR